MGMKIKILIRGNGNGNGNGRVGMGWNGNTDCVSAHLYPLAASSSHAAAYLSVFI